MISAVQALAYRGYRALESREHELKYCFLEITRRCSLSCRHCGSDCSSESSMNELSTGEWLNLIDAIHKRFSPIFVLTGGEPLIHPELELITEKLHSVRARWGLVTNGMLLTDERLKKLTDHGISAVTLSLDGTESAHRYLRKHPQSWSSAVRSLSLLAESSVQFADVVTCVWPDNLKNLNETAELLISKGIKRWRLFRIFPKGAAANAPELMLSFAQSRELIEWISDNRETYRRKGLDVSFSCEGYVQFALDRKIRQEPFFCRAGISIASVLADGTITGCNNNGCDFSQGTVRTDNFAEVWQNRFSEYRDHRWKRTGICSDCSEWNYCHGGSIHLREKGWQDPLFCFVRELKS